VGPGPGDRSSGGDAVVQVAERGDGAGRAIFAGVATATAAATRLAQETGRSYSVRPYRPTAVGSDVGSARPRLYEVVECEVVSSAGPDDPAAASLRRAMALLRNLAPALLLILWSACAPGRGTSYRCERFDYRQVGDSGGWVVADSWSWCVETNRDLGRARSAHPCDRQDRCRVDCQPVGGRNGPCDAAEWRELMTTEHR
jgi:hypothetical protein